MYKVPGQPWESPHLPATQTAIVQGANGKLEIRHNVPLPKLEPGMILVKTAAVALNPCDWKMAERFPTPDATDGCDFSGTVVALGSQIEQYRSWKIGDRVCGAVNGSNPIDHQTGSFAEYVGADAEFTFRLPDSASFDTGAGIGGTGIGTLGLALFRSLGLTGTPTKPAQNPQEVLIYGGSTSVGTLAIQLLKLCGHKPITTCSPRNFPLVKSYGAEEVFDYNSPTCAQDIKTYTKNSLRYVLDPLTEVKTMKLCYAAIGRAGGRYTCLEMYHDHVATRKTVKPDLVMGISILGRKVALDYGYESEADPEKRAFGVEWYREVQTLIDGGRLRTHPLKVLTGRWESILEGLVLLRDRRVSGEKLIVPIS